MLKRNWIRYLLILPVAALGFAIGALAPMGWIYLRDSFFPGSLVEWDKFDDATKAAARAQAYLYADIYSYVLAGVVLIVVVWITVKEKWTPLRIVFLLGILTPSALWLLLLSYF